MGIDCHGFGRAFAPDFGNRKHEFVSNSQNVRGVGWACGGGAGQTVVGTTKLGCLPCI